MMCRIKQSAVKKPINIAVKAKPKTNINVANGIKVIRDESPDLPALPDLITHYKLGRL